MKYLLVFLFCLPAFAQSYITYNSEHINKLDAENRKEGLWKVFNQNNNVTAICEFKDGLKITPMRYYKDSKLFLTCDESEIILHKGNDSIHIRYIGTAGKGKWLDQYDKEIDAELIELYKNNTIEPMYYGGLPVLYEYLKNSIDQRKVKHTKGKVIVLFTLDNNGFVDTAEIQASTDPILNDEAVRVVKTMPRWQPGVQGGKFVKVRYNLPISFN